jgi:hypothetical protein
VLVLALPLLLVPVEPEPLVDDGLTTTQLPPTHANPWQQTKSVLLHARPLGWHWPEVPVLDGPVLMTPVVALVELEPEPPVECAPELLLEELLGVPE